MKILLNKNLKRKVKSVFYVLPWIALTVTFAPPLTQAAFSKEANLLNPLREILTGPICDLHDDEQGIPHVRSLLTGKSAELGVLACMGYLHGRDRAWEMDHFRRTAQGRTAEVYGKPGVHSDFLMRLLGLAEQAKSLFNQLGVSDQNRFWAYTYGANQGIQVALEKGVYEFNDLNYSPEPWKPEDSISILLLQSFAQTRQDFFVQLREADRIHTHHDQTPHLFNPKGLPWDTSVLKEGEYPQKPAPAAPSALAPQALDPAQKSFDTAVAKVLQSFDFFPPRKTGEGSNNWVLAPSRTEDGHAWLANDPHLELNYPAPSGTGLTSPTVPTTKSSAQPSRACPSS